MKVRRIEKLAKIVAERRRECRHASACFDQVFRSAGGHHAAADDDCSLAAKVEKYRQMAHGYPAPDRNARAARLGSRGLRGAVDQFTRRPF